MVRTLLAGMKEMKNKEDSSLDIAIKEAQDCSANGTKIVSSIARQLAFSEGAVFWLLHHEYGTGLEILLGIFFSSLILYMIFDFFQYVLIASRFEHLVNFLKSIKKQNETAKIEFIRSDSYTKSSDICYAIKIIFLIISSILLIIMFAFFLAKP